MDQDERIAQLKEEVRRLAGGEDRSGGIDDLPKDMAEEFLQRIIAFETAPTTTDFEQLTKDGIPLPPPDDVDDRDINAVLWRVIEALAVHRTFLHRTNHLSDRDLYSVLWHTVMREEITVMPGDATGAYHVDIPGDDVEGTAYLTYYADDAQREFWRRDCPDMALPSRQQPAFDRDDALPAVDW